LVSPLCMSAHLRCHFESAGTKDCLVGAVAAAISCLQGRRCRFFARNREKLVVVVVVVCCRCHSPLALPFPPPVFARNREKLVKDCLVGAVAVAISCLQGRRCRFFARNREKLVVMVVVVCCRCRSPLALALPFPPPVFCEKPGKTGRGRAYSCSEPAFGGGEFLPLPFPLALALALPFPPSVFCEKP